MWQAHAVHPITAVELEWSLWTREAEVPQPVFLALASFPRRPPPDHHKFSVESCLAATCFKNWHALPFSASHLMRSGELACRGNWEPKTGFRCL